MAENRTRLRAKANFPTVLLTLLSIVQALALELLWSHLGEQAYLYQWTFGAVLGWLQIAATLLGILLIWLIYSDLVLRFSWVPTTTDAIFPFLVGILEFAQISALGPATIGPWFAILATLFAAMAWISQITMKRARLDYDNHDFFVHIPPATKRDLLNTMVPVGVLLFVSAILWVSGDQGWIALTAILGAIALLGYQMRMNHIFTQRSYRQKASQDTNQDTPQDTYRDSHQKEATRED